MGANQKEHAWQMDPHCKYSSFFIDSLSYTLPVQSGLENRTRKTEGHPISERFKSRKSNGPFSNIRNYGLFEIVTEENIG